MREHKRHTTRRVASLRSATLSSGGGSGYPHPLMMGVAPCQPDGVPPPIRKDRDNTPPQLAEWGCAPPPPVSLLPGCGQTHRRV